MPHQCAGELADPVLYSCIIVACTFRVILTLISSTSGIQPQAGQGNFIICRRVSDDGGIKRTGRVLALTLATQFGTLIAVYWTTWTKRIVIWASAPSGAQPRSPSPFGWLSPLSRYPAMSAADDDHAQHEKPVDPPQYDIGPDSSPYDYGGDDDSAISVYQRPTGLKGFWYGTYTQVALLGFVCFMCPGLFNSLNGLGGGGQIDTETSANANSTLYATFTVAAFFAGYVARLVSLAI